MNEERIERLAGTKHRNPMNIRALIFIVSLMAVVPGNLVAGLIQYANIGTEAATNTFTAGTTGSLYAYFYGSEAGDNDSVKLYANGVALGSGVDNKGPSAILGQEFFLGNVLAGDVLRFDLINSSTGQTFSSDPAYSEDHHNHAYATTYSGSALIPAGTFLGFEDLGIPGSDLDYNDDTLVFSIHGRAASSSATSNPEPASVLLLGAGLILIGLVGRKIKSFLR
jgi:hypothetical protein